MYIVLHEGPFGTQAVIGNKDGKPFRTEKAAGKVADKHYDHKSTTKDDSFKVYEIVPSEL